MVEHSMARVVSVVVPVGGDANGFRGFFLEGDALIGDAEA